MICRILADELFFPLESEQSIVKLMFISVGCRSTAHLWQKWGHSWIPTRVCSKLRDSWHRNPLWAGKDPREDLIWNLQKPPKETPCLFTLWTFNELWSVFLNFFRYPPPLWTCMLCPHGAPTTPRAPTAPAPRPARIAPPANLAHSAPPRSARCPRAPESQTLEPRGSPAPLSTPGNRGHKIRSACGGHGPPPPPTPDQVPSEGAEVRRGGKDGWGILQHPDAAGGLVPGPLSYLLGI